jgi:hypothetical protein
MVGRGRYRDIGRLAKDTFEMGRGGDLLSLSLSVPPWTDLYELSPAELRLTNLVAAYSIAEVPVPNRSADALARRRCRSECARSDQHIAQVGKGRRSYPVVSRCRKVLMRSERLPKVFARGGFWRKASVPPALTSVFGV